MQSIQKITIPEPCHQKWNEMTPVEQGRHCAHCSKTVTDFTRMTNNEILDYFAQRNNVCGRFDTEQLNALNGYIDRQKTPRISWEKLALAAALTSLFTTTQAQDERTLGKVAVSQPAMIFKNKIVSDTVTYTTIQGKIIGDDDNAGLPGVTVRVKGTDAGTITNTNGEFWLKVPSTAHSLQISLIGYETYEASVAGFKGQSNCVSLKMRSFMLGGAISVVRKVPFYKRWWYKAKNIF